MSNSLQKCKSNLQLFFSHVRTFFKALFTDVESFIDTHVVPILNFLEGFKAVIDSPALDTIAAFLTGVAGKVPEEILAGIRKAIDQVIVDLELVQAVEAAATFEEKLQVIAQFIATLPQALQGNALHRIASTLVRELAPTDAHKMDTVWRDTITQFVYNEQYHINNPDKPVSSSPAPIDRGASAAAKPEVQAEVKTEGKTDAAPAEVKTDAPAQTEEKTAETAEAPGTKVEVVEVPEEAKVDPTHPFWNKTS